MVDEPTGYLIVERNDRQGRATGAPNYKGLYRGPGWSQQAYEAGFDDPLVFGKYTNSVGLIPGVDAALDVLKRFASIQPVSELEIVWTRRRDAPVSVPDGFSYLGIDVACSAPFWSIVADPPSGDFVKAAIHRLNRNGLLNDENDAVRYLAEYRSHHPEKADVDLFLWEVYATPVALTRSPR